MLVGLSVEHGLNPRKRSTYCVNVSTWVTPCNNERGVHLIHGKNLKNSLEDHRKLLTTRSRDNLNCELSYQASGTITLHVWPTIILREIRRNDAGSRSIMLWTQHLRFTTISLYGGGRIPPTTWEIYVPERPWGQVHFEINQLLWIGKEARTAFHKGCAKNEKTFVSITWCWRRVKFIHASLRTGEITIWNSCFPPVVRRVNVLVKHATFRKHDSTGYCVQVGR